MPDAKQLTCSKTKWKSIYKQKKNMENEQMNWLKIT